ncbi:MAG: CPBP family intramembrane metalloprotease [Planctomycetes bacterium]|nr:CPBP family intramembrane metalloprotease [Planctomycetota bacterium]
MPTDAQQKGPSSPFRYGPLRVGVAITLASIYCLVFLVRLSPSWPSPVRRFARESTGRIYGWIDSGLGAVGIESVSRELRFGVYLVVMAGLLPWLVMALLRRGRPDDLGCRLPNRLAWRFVLVGYLVTLPLLFWMVRGADFASHYVPHLNRAGLGPYLLFHLANLLSEHFFFHGVLLSAFRVELRWPSPPEVTENATDGLNRALQWFGLAQPVVGQGRCHRMAQWIGLPHGCGLAVLASGLLFGLVHMSKDPRELALSIPGGVAAAFLSYRTNSWLTPFVIHLAIAGTALTLVAYRL